MVTGPNDLLANAEVITFDGVNPWISPRYDNLGAGVEPGENTQPADYPLGATLWWKWTANISGTVTFDTILSGQDTEVGIYTAAPSGTSDVGGIKVVTNAPNYMGLQAKQAFTTNKSITISAIRVENATTSEPQTTYIGIATPFSGSQVPWVARATVPPSSPTGVQTYQLDAPVTLPAGDYSFVTQGNGVLRINAQEPKEFSAPFGAVTTYGPLYYGDRWAQGPYSSYSYIFALVGPGAVTMASLTKVAADSDSGGSDYSSLVTMQAVEGTTYYVQVGTYSGQTINSMQLRLSAGTVEVNDQNAPTLEFNILEAPDENGEYDAATVLLGAYDDVDGVDLASAEYNLDGQGWLPYHHNDVLPTITAPGLHTVAQRATDHAGNSTSVETSSFVIKGTTPPPTPDQSVQLGTAQARDTVLTITPSLSGGGGDPQPPGDNTQIAKAATTDLVYDITPQLGTVQAVELGLVEERSIVSFVALPVAAPTLSVVLPEPTIDQAPAVIPVRIGNGVAGEMVTLSLPGYPSLLTAELDSTGGTAVDLLLPEIDAGSWTVSAAGTASERGTADLLVMAAALVVVEEANNPSLPPDVDQGVTHWRLVDRSNGRTFTFPHNPAKWTSPFPPNVLEHEYSSSPAGQPLTWQGAEKGWAFEFSGYLDTQALYAELQYWASLNRRFWLIDHRNVRRYVTFEQFDAKPRIVPGKPWATDYTVRVLQFRWEA